MTEFEKEITKKLDQIINVQNDHSRLLNEHSGSLKILLDNIGHTPENLKSLNKIEKGAPKRRRKIFQ